LPGSETLTDAIWKRLAANAQPVLTNYTITYELDRLLSRVSSLGRGEELRAPSGAHRLHESTILAVFITRSDHFDLRIALECHPGGSYLRGERAASRPALSLRRYQ
jgi:hypothetical protein